MKLHFLGTGAADWNIEDKDKKDFRFFSSCLIDCDLLIDPGPHIFLSAKKYNIDLSKVKYVINTHSHSDHFNQEALQRLIYNGAEFISFTEGESKTFGEYSVKALKANHATCKGAVHFIIEKQGKSLFYGLDSCWLMYDEVAAIKKNGVDAAVLDGTIGNIKGDFRVFEHNNLAMIKEMKYTLEPFVKRFIISHMAYTLHDDHKTLAADMSSYGIEVAFDNWETEI